MTQLTISPHPLETPDDGPSSPTSSELEGVTLQLPPGHAVALASILREWHEGRRGRTRRTTRT
jgi:hypothetical protein